MERKKEGEGSHGVPVRFESVAAAFPLFLPCCGSHAVTLRLYRVTFRNVGRGLHKATKYCCSDSMSTVQRPDLSKKWQKKQFSVSSRWKGA